MNRPDDILINQFQLNVLLEKDQKQGFEFIINQGVFCGTCKGICSKGIDITEIHLNSLNDIMIRGHCKSCNGKVSRILEFGEDKKFYKKATEFRKSIKN